MRGSTSTRGVGHRENHGPQNHGAVTPENFAGVESVRFRPNSPRAHLTLDALLGIQRFTHANHAPTRALFAFVLGTHQPAKPGQPYLKRKNRTMKPARASAGRIQRDQTTLQSVLRAENGPESARYNHNHGL